MPRSPTAAWVTVSRSSPAGALYAPSDATVVAAFPTGHAIGLRHADGLELLIHIGIDTVKLGGAHFTPKVTAGQQVSAGDLLVEFDRAAIEAAGYDLTTPVIVTNPDLPTCTAWLRDRSAVRPDAPALTSGRSPAQVPTTCSRRMSVVVEWLIAPSR